MKKGCLLFAMLFVFSGLLFAEFPEKAQPYVHVYDYTNQLTTEQKAWFNENAHNYLQTGKGQIVTALITNDQFDRYGNIEDAANDIFNTWGIGESKEKSNGILILLAPGRRKVRIEVGYDLEKWLTDGTTGHILDENLEYYKQGQWFEALKGTFLGVQTAIDQGYQKDKETSVSPKSLNQEWSKKDTLKLMGILLIGFFIFLAIFLNENISYKKYAIEYTQALKEEIKRAKKFSYVQFDERKLQKIEAIENKLKLISKIKKPKKRHDFVQGLYMDVRDLLEVVHNHHRFPVSDGYYSHSDDHNSGSSDNFDNSGSNNSSGSGGFGGGMSGGGGASRGF
jgi:uncharacterized membrane protein YgcG